VGREFESLRARQLKKRVSRFFLLPFFYFRHFSGKISGSIGNQHQIRRLSPATAHNCFGSLDEVIKLRYGSYQFVRVDFIEICPVGLPV